VRWAPRSTPVLVELLGVADGIVAYLAADTLARIGAPAVLPVAAKLAAAEPETRRRAAELLEKLPPAGAGEPAVLESLGVLAERDPRWIVRAQAARALGARGARHAHKGYAATVLARALADPDPEVVKSALEGLATLGESSAIPALIRSLERAARDGELAALLAAQTALRRLTGETVDHDPEQWWEWWERWRARATPPPANPGGSGG
jgi:HEAT repeat protein